MNTSQLDNKILNYLVNNFVPDKYNMLWVESVAIEIKTTTEVLLKRLEFFEDAGYISEGGAAFGNYKYLLDINKCRNKLSLGGF